VSDQELFGSVRDILTYGLNTNSYKFALLRALARWGKEGKQETIIERAWLAERFLEFYWPLANNFRIRQSTNSSREPVAWTWAQRAAEEMRLTPNASFADYRRKCSDHAEALVARLARAGGCLDEVLPRFHGLPRGRSVEAQLYSLDGTKLRLSETASVFLADYADVIEMLAVGAWVRFSERYSAAPRMYEKVSGILPQRRALKPYMSFLMTTQDGDLCFYCHRKEVSGWSVDHVLPWSFVLEDRAWNLVICCETCNSRKSDGIPASGVIDRLMDRNRRFLVAPPQALPVRVRAELKEWRDRDLGAHVRQLHAAAVSEGFPDWRG
jgi:hypothetical protein